MLELVAVPVGRPTRVMHADRLLLRQFAETLVPWWQETTADKSGISSDVLALPATGHKVIKGGAQVPQCVVALLVGQGVVAVAELIEQPVCPHDELSLL